MSKPEWIFECSKCQHNIYVDKPKLKKLLKTDCPECGEEAARNWILVDEGEFSKR